MRSVGSATTSQPNGLAISVTSVDSNVLADPGSWLASPGPGEGRGLPPGAGRPHHPVQFGEPVHGGRRTPAAAGEKQPQGIAGPEFSGRVRRRGVRERGIRERGIRDGRGPDRGTEDLARGQRTRVGDQLQGRAAAARQPADHERAAPVGSRQDRGQDRDEVLLG
jgi:hypothetical protein